MSSNNILKKLYDAIWLKYKLKKLRYAMWRVKWLFHFTRNNPCHTQRFYHEFIKTIGLDEWKKLNPEMRNAWNAAAGSFDKQYGLVKAWRGIEFKGEPYLDGKTRNEPDVEELNNKAKKLEKLVDQLDRVLKAAIAAKVDADTLTRSTVKKLSELAAEMGETAERLVPKQADSKKPKQKN
ncbi:MAG: hypothetical protein II871_03525 [Clostridia bacterium]|nr:hypothetical protein [Clostridia bacterium]